MADPQSTVAGPAFITRDDSEVEREFLMDFLEKSDGLRERYRSTWDEMLENYLVASPNSIMGGARSYGISGLLQPNHRSNRGSMVYLKDPETHQLVETLVAQAITLLLSSDDFIEVAPIGSDDYEKSRFLGRVLSAVLHQPGAFRTIYEVLKDSFLFGTAIVEIGWETRSRQQVVSRPNIDRFGFVSGKELSVEDVVYRDRPLIRGVDIYDFYPDPSGTRIQEDMLGAAKRFRIHANGARGMERSGAYNRPEAVRRAIALATSSDPKHKGVRAANDSRFISDEVVGKYGLMPGFVFYGEVPYKPKDGARNRCLGMLNGEMVASYVNPFLDGNIPWKEIVMNPVGGRFYGLSPAEVVRYLQDSTDHFLMSLTEATNLALRGPMQVGSAWGGDVERAKRGMQNDWLEVNDVTAIGPVPRDLSVLALSQQELQRRKQTMREASGATNPLQAIPGNDRQTATEVATLVRLATQRTDVMVRLIERDDFPWIGRTLHSRLRQFLPDAKTAMNLAGEQFTVSLEEIDFDADVRFVGSRQAQTPQQKAQSYTAMLQMLGVNPQLVAIYPDLFTRIFRDGFQVPDAEQIVQRAVQTVMAMQAQEQQASATPGQTPVSEAEAATLGGGAL